MPSFRSTTPRNELVAYRRHSKNCVAKKTLPTYDPRIRLDEKDNGPAEIDNCDCSIVVSGHLALELKPIRHLALGTADWIEARERLRHLEISQRVEIPENQEPDVITPAYAVAKFLASKGPTSSKPIKTYNKYEVLLGTPAKKATEPGKEDQPAKGRLIPWCEKKTITDIRMLESKVIVEEFVQSWRCLDADEPLAASTKTVDITRLRCFLDYCMDDGWIKKNVAKKIKVEKPKHDDIDLNHGLELEEYELVLNAFKYYPKPKWIGKSDLTLERIYAAIELMRWCGLRASDATKFNSSELIRNGNKDGFCAYYKQQKTGYYILEPVPVPDHVIQLLEALTPMFVRDGKKYWFCMESGLDNLIAATVLIEEKIQRVFGLAQNPDLGGKPFRYPNSTPHCLRDTFAIQHIIHGRDIRQVSRWLGHRSITVTEKAYARPIQSLMLKDHRDGTDSNARQLEKITLLRQKAKP